MENESRGTCEQLDYRALYEEAKAKLDAIDYEKLKEEIDDRLAIKSHITDPYRTIDNMKRRDEIVHHRYFAFLGNLYSDETVDKVIIEIGWEKLTKIIDDIYTDVAKSETVKETKE